MGINRGVLVNGEFRINDKGSFIKMIEDDGSFVIFKEWKSLRGDDSNKPSKEWGIKIAESINSAFKKGVKDSERIDKLERLTKGYGKGWILRDSLTGRGMRLHEHSGEGTYPTVREAIDNFKE